MAIYAVGDIQGCYDPLRRVLDRVGFDPDADVLWSVGDMVNRGPQSLEVLRYLRGLGAACKAVLGNHDLHLLAVMFGARPAKKKDTFDEILSAEDRSELQTWLRALPLAHYEHGTLMLHAGVIPSWTLSDTLEHAGNVQAALRGDQAQDFLRYMYGNTPHTFNDALAGWERLRVITNILTRLRFCAADGQLDLECAAAPGAGPEGMLPWYAHSARKTQQVPIVFGHWATLNGELDEPNLFALDTGCVWGNELTLMRLQDKQRISCDCSALASAAGGRD